MLREQPVVNAEVSQQGKGHDLMHVVLSASCRDYLLIILTAPERLAIFLMLLMTNSGW